MAVLSALAGLAGIGSAIGLGSSGDRADSKKQRRDLEKEGTLLNAYRDSLNNDPLLAMIQSQINNQGARINPKEIFRNASNQIDAVGRRRYGETLQSLAGFGFEASGAQADFAGQQLQAAQRSQKASVKDFIDTSFLQADPARRAALAGERLNMSAILSGLQGDASSPLGTAGLPQGEDKKRLDQGFNDFIATMDPQLGFFQSHFGEGPFGDLQLGGSGRTGAGPNVPQQAGPQQANDPSYAQQDPNNPFA